MRLQSDVRNPSCGSAESRSNAWEGGVGAQLAAQHSSRLAAGRQWGSPQHTQLACQTVLHHPRAPRWAFRVIAKEYNKERQSGACL